MKTLPWKGSWPVVLSPYKSPEKTPSRSALWRVELAEISTEREDAEYTPAFVSTVLTPDYLHTVTSHVFTTTYHRSTDYVYILYLK